MGIVFTFCDNVDMKKMVDKMKPAVGKINKCKCWTESFKKACKQEVFNNMSDDNVFFFYSNGETTGPKTTQGDLL